jgi:hypothetical protein
LNASNTLQQVNQLIDYSGIISSAMHSAYFSICKAGFIDGVEGCIDHHISKLVQDRCIMDFARIAIRHPNIANPDVHKVAAYSTYWINKLHPLQTLIPYKEYNHNFSGYLNELLALFTGLSILQTKARKCGESFPLESIKQPLNDLLYVFKYCIQNPDSLGIMYYFIDQAISKK